MTDMVPLALRLPDLAQRETRVAHVSGNAELPDGEYAFVELYCDDPDCDCRRVLINVMRQDREPRILATLNFGWESQRYYEKWAGHRLLARGIAGVAVEPFGPQSEHTPALARLFEWVLRDQAYLDRLKRHYAAFKDELRRPGPRVGPGARGERGRPRLARAQAKNLAFRFHVALEEIDPPIWRRIEVPASYTFWDLHVAIQDAMGWTDSHLHVFELEPPGGGEPVQIGSPIDEDFADEPPARVGWEVPLREFFGEPGDEAVYEYDFGDSWTHRVKLEEVVPAHRARGKARCLAGERACPPEDCGGVTGYEELLEAMRAPDSEAYDEFVEWLGAPYDAEAFRPEDVRFGDPRARRRFAYGP